MRYSLEHITTYQYQQPTALSYNEAWMTPRHLSYQKVEQSEILLIPPAASLHFRHDFFGNKVAWFSVQQSHLHFKIHAKSILDRGVPENITNPSNARWSTLKNALTGFDKNLNEVKAFSLQSPMVPILKELKDYAMVSFDRYEIFYDAVMDLNSRIFEEFEYNTSFTTIATPLKKVASARKGVCQDFSHIAIGCLRAMGLPVRYVSGYIETQAPDGQPKLVGADASHAWFSCFIPGMGWVDFDPTNNKLAAEQHITVAWGRDYQDVPPLKGVIFNSAQHELSVAVHVKRLD